MASGWPLHVVIPTHTPRYLDLVLVGLARQARAPASVTVSCDNDEASIGAVIQRWAGEIEGGVWWVRRASHGEERLCQVRNNAVRSIVEREGADRGRVLVLDGDTVPGEACVARHADLGARRDLVLGYRVNVDEETSRGLDASLLLAGEQSLEASAEDVARLVRRDRRYAKHLLMRRLRLGDLHKPKLLGGHFSCDLGLYVRLNGFDELYRGWGFKDDEFAFRAARMGASVRPACAGILVFHLHHETRQPEGPMAELPTARRFEKRKTLPDVCEHGIEHPLEQHEIEVSHITGA